MKKSILLLIIAISCAMQSFAYDFPTLAPSGQIIYLNIVDSENHTACVTYPNYINGIYYYGYDKPTGDLIIPETFTNGNVTWTIVSIGDHAFDYCTGLTSIEIPNTVTTIGEQAFYHCENATDIKLSESLTTVGYFAFGYCTKWTGTLNIPASMVSVGRCAFDVCTNLSGLSLPNKNVEYSYLCFANCGFEGQLVFPDSLTTIVHEMFTSCEKITDVVFPNTLTSIENSAFAYCTSLTAIHIPSSTSRIDGYSSYSENPFRGCRCFSDLMTGSKDAILRSSLKLHFIFLQALTKAAPARPRLFVSIVLTDTMPFPPPVPDDAQRWPQVAAGVWQCASQ